MKRPKIVVTMAGRDGHARGEAVRVTLATPLPVNNKLMLEYLSGDTITLCRFLQGQPTAIYHDGDGNWTLEQISSFCWPTEPSESIIEEVKELVEGLASQLDAYSRAINYRDFGKIAFLV